MPDHYLTHYVQYHREMEDFWDRRHLAPQFSRHIMLFGREVAVMSNHEGVLAALDYSLPLFATVPAGRLPMLPGFQVQIGVHPARVPPGPPDDDLVQQLWYSGDSTWLMIHAGGWGHAHVEMARRQATLVLAPELAGRPDLVSRCLLNTVLLNLCLGNGDGMLHASCLERAGRALLLLAPHNTGKSTTALRLVQHGFRLVSDSMIHILPGGATGTYSGPVLAGFPVGRIKLRADMLPQFPHLREQVQTEQVRDEMKFALDLRQIMPDRIIDHAIAPEELVFCLLAQNGAAPTNWTPAGEAEVWAAIMENSIFYDTPMVWEKNLAQIERVLQRARLFHLRLGNDPAGILAAVDALWAT